MQMDSILHGNTIIGITNKLFIKQPEQDSLTGSITLISSAVTSI